MKTGWGTGGEKKKDAQESGTGKKAGEKAGAESAVKQKHFVYATICQANK